MTDLPDGSNPVDQRRILRLVNAGLTEDADQVVTVFDEFELDPRGRMFAMGAVISGLTASLGAAWVSQSNVDTVLESIRMMLLQSAADEVGNG